MKRILLGLLLLTAAIEIGCRPQKTESPSEEVKQQYEAKQTAVELQALELKIPLTNDGTWKATASSVEKDLAPEKAVDGSLKTRWGSDFRDGQWWIVDFGKPELLTSVTIVWEDAFAQMFTIDLSEDGRVWTTVFGERSGSGGITDVRFEPRTARYVRVYCDTRATQWGFSFYEVFFNRPSWPVPKATASSGSGDYEAKFAIDNNFKTRWSSEFRDDEWWQVEFPEPTPVAGLKIFWETAFAEKYDVLCSDDGQVWQRTYSVVDGDGQTDLLLFRVVTTRFVRIHCRQRGTGWGNSIWEVVFLHTAAVATASSAESEWTSPEFAIDGLMATLWRSSPGDAEPWWSVELPEEWEIGGVDLYWGPAFAKSYDVEVSRDGVSWQKVYSEKSGNGRRDMVYFPATPARWIRIRCLESSEDDGVVEIEQFEAKSREEQLTPLRAFQAAARNMPLGYYPMWLTRRQEFWTVVGLPDDHAESLLSETGIVEPFKGSFSVQPFVLEDGDLVSWSQVQTFQSLEKGYLPLPTVEWYGSDWKLEISAFAVGRVSDAQTAVRYRVTNLGSTNRTLGLALAARALQLNPVWQHGGVSPIYKAEWRTEAKPIELRIHDRTAMMLLARPNRVGLAPFDAGDITDFLERGSFPTEVLATNSLGLVGAGVLYEFALQPNESAEAIVLFPLYETSSVKAAWVDRPSLAFDKAWKEATEKWEEFLSLPRLTIPEKKLEQVIRSNLGYILINRDAPWFKPGTRNYNHAWMRDGALTGEALLRVGLFDLVKEYVLNISKHVNAEGWVPFIIWEDGRPSGFNPDKNGGEGHEFDSQGEFVFIVRRYYDFTKDRKTLETVYPAVVRALQYGREIRRMRLTEAYRDTEFWGILPHSNSHEGYYPAKHSYWDDFWMLRGLKDGAYLAEVMGRKEDAEWMREEERDLRACLLESIRKVVAKHGISYIPGCAELGDEDPTSTSIAIMACDETDHLPQDLLRNTFERYQQRIERRYRGEADTFTPYEARNADAFVRLGQRERALALLRHLAYRCTRPPPWNHLAEVVHAEYRAPSYIGDMPHTWVGADLINAFLSLFVFERGDQLVLGAGLDPAWLEEGVSVEDWPTRFGRVSYEVKRVDNRLQISVSGTVSPPEGCVWQLPESLWEGAIAVSGEPVIHEKGKIVLPPLPAVIEIALESDSDS